MTIEIERYRAIAHAKALLEGLFRAKQKDIKIHELRQEIRHVLRHYPEDIWIQKKMEECEYYREANRELVKVVGEIKADNFLKPSVNKKEPKTPTDRGNTALTNRVESVATKRKTKVGRCAD